MTTPSADTLERESLETMTARCSATEPLVIRG